MRTYNIININIRKASLRGFLFSMIDGQTDGQNAILITKNQFFKVEVNRTTLK